MKLYCAPALALLLALAGTPALAQVHRCVDANGKVSFSDTVCNGERAQKVFGSDASARGWTVEPYRPPASAGTAQVAKAAAPASK
ncbi:DUF4124 domain-containing protein [Variovorax sp. J22G21]|uniref:DUF4124 domain-containing protein n=1 Tax=Variovorax fucosicus TaxID=3053517 RepID=UPI002575B1BE|nr:MULTISPECIES: DUF4124 domain-containing protein [unclassified Variovorax]MDM0042412.1 DUF4124 domain-containing protein [Variovorax sp. J22R193]MDM0054510.1 DUF4124 domain-containing protein [Variovorax sp. J22G47]MDM0061017.1 DUF4124 domain-containing protein [Variovorax sp. J22G21]